MFSPSQQGVTDKRTCSTGTLREKGERTFPNMLRASVVETDLRAG